MASILLVVTSQHGAGCTHVCARRAQRDAGPSRLSSYARCPASLRAAASVRSFGRANITRHSMRMHPKERQRAARPLLPGAWRGWVTCPWLPMRAGRRPFPEDRGPTGGGWRLARRPLPGEGPERLWTLLLKTLGRRHCAPAGLRVIERMYCAPMRPEVYPPPNAGTSRGERSVSESSAPGTPRYRSRRHRHSWPLRATQGSGRGLSCQRSGSLRS